MRSQIERISFLAFIYNKAMDFVFLVRSRLSPQQFLIFSAIVIGVVAGLASVFLKTLVHSIYQGLTSSPGIAKFNFAYLFLPLAGILITVLIIRYFLEGKLEKGNAPILKAIIHRSAILPLRNTYSHFITSAITVGFGGSAGLESPIVSTGSAIGSNYARVLKLPYRERVLLLAGGAAAGIAAAFNAPIAGVLFALEVLTVDVTISSFIPLIISAAAGALCSKVLLQDEALLTFKQIKEFDYRNVPFYIGLSLIAGLVSVYYSRMYTGIESFFHQRKKKIISNALIGGLLLAVLIFLFPTLFGEGYQSIKLIAAGNPAHILTNSPLSIFYSSQWVVLAIIVVIMLSKVVAAALTAGSGGNGGNFAPSLFVGGYLGFAFSHVINLTGITKLPVGNFTIVGMSAVLAGVFYAPLTAVFLCAEITGGYELIIPLMIACSLTFVIARYFEPMSMDSRKLATNEHILTQNKDTAVLSSMTLGNYIESDFTVLTNTMTLGDFVNVISKTNRNLFPVIDENGAFEGLIFTNDVRGLLFETSQYQNLKLHSLIKRQSVTVNIDDDMHILMEKFDKSGMWKLAVLNGTQFVGIISKSNVLSKYRSQLVASP